MLMNYVSAKAAFKLSLFLYTLYNYCQFLIGVRNDIKQRYIPERVIDDYEEERNSQYIGHDAQHLRERDFDDQPYVGSGSSDAC